MDFINVLIFGFATTTIIFSIIKIQGSYNKNNKQHHITKLKDECQLLTCDLLPFIPDATIICDNNGSIINYNDAAKTLFGYSGDELSSKKIDYLFPEYLRSKCTDYWKKNICYKMANNNHDLWIVTKKNKHIPVEISVGVITKNDLKLTIMVFNDITLRKQHETQIEQLAYYDPLTKFPNRTLFNNTAKQKIKEAKRLNKQFGMFIIDIDNFKHVNDMYGHYAGDQLLKEVALRLQSLLIEFPNVFFARLGGDEFVGITDVTQDGLDIDKLITSIFNKINDYMWVDRKRINVRISAGVGIFPKDGNRTTTLLHSADLALYSAKHNGKNKWCFHEPFMKSQAEEQICLRQAATELSRTGNFVMHYQPIYDVQKKLIIGAEALFRSNTELFPTIRSYKIIDTAEQTEEINQLGEHILNKISHDIKPLINQFPDFVISINLSVKELANSNFVERTHNLLQQQNIKPKNIRFEVTETVLIETQGNQIDKLNQLRDLGYHLSIDDFGKGFSSMSYIRQLPVNTIKIDKEFVDDVTTDEKTKELIRGIINIANILKMSTCAEGVEQFDQMETLRKLNVTYIQGYFIARPTSIETLLQMVKSQYK